MASYDEPQRQPSPASVKSTSSDLNRPDSKEGSHRILQSSSRSSSAGERPASALARGIQIVEYDNSAVTRLNPRPVINAVDESVVLLEEYLCPRKLVRLCADDVRDLTGIDNLEEVQFLELRVDTRDTSLGNFGMHVPNLTQLKLSNSIIACMRDLGSCLNNVQVLWMARCSTVDLDGVAALSNLSELYLSFNDITDISPCSLLEQLQILDLEGNNIDDIAQVEFLSLCPCLAKLTLEGNPVCISPNPTTCDPKYDYRDTVRRTLPNLKLLDDEPLLDRDSQPSRCKSVFDEDWKLIEDLMNDGIVLQDDAVEDVPGRVGTAWQNTAPYRPGSALKAQTPLRPGSSSTTRSGSLPGTADSGRPSTSRLGSAANDDDASCELTTGSVVCGNAARALKARQRGLNNQPAAANKINKNFLSEFKFKPEHTYDVSSLEDDEKIKSLVDELRQWKEEHKKRVAEINASRAPQILTIDHSDSAVVDLSDVEDDNSECSDVELADIDCLESVRQNGRQLIVPQNLLPSISPSDVTRRPDVAQEDAVLRKVYKKHSITNPATSSAVLSSGEPLPMASDVTTARPLSGPAAVSHSKLRLDPVTNKLLPEDADPHRPVVKGPTLSTMEGPARVSKLHRALTSKALLGQVPATASSTVVAPSRVGPALRPAGLSNVQLLPSKLTK